MSTAFPDKNSSGVHVDRSLISSSGPVLVHAEGLRLREWAGCDVPRMVAMFNTAEMDRWTPLAHPFDEGVAAAYVEHARRARADGTLHLAITEDGEEPLGEVLLFPTDVAHTCEFAYAVGADHRGRALAARAVRAVLSLSKTEGYLMSRLRIAVDNEPSQHVARMVGFVRTEEPLLRRERKGYALEMATWIRTIS